MLVPEKCERDQYHRDDPQHDVFTTVFFLCHGEKYSTQAGLIQVLRCIRAVKAAGRYLGLAAGAEERL